MMGQGDAGIFLDRPISMSLILAMAVIIVGTVLAKRVMAHRRAQADKAGH